MQHRGVDFAKIQCFSILAYCRIGTYEPNTSAHKQSHRDQKVFLRASASTQQKRVLESHRFEEVPWTARHLQWPEVISSDASLRFLVLSERLRTASAEQQEQSSSTNEMAQRRTFKAVLLLHRQPGAHGHQSETKGASRGSYRHGYRRDVRPLSAAFADCRTVPTGLKGSNIKWATALSTFPSSLRGTLCSETVCCGLGFVVFNDVKSKTSEWPLVSLAVFYQYLVSNTDNFAGGESK